MLRHKVKYTIPNKSTFFSTDENIFIYDKDGNLFYEHPLNGAQGITFNLPNGTYWTNNTLRHVEQFMPYPKLEYDGLNYAPPYDVDVKEGENPHRASVWIGQRHMLVDMESLKKFKYIPLYYFVIGHELGHFKFNNSKGEKLSEHESDAKELACDMYAYNRMMDAGFNPSQVVIAAYLTLSHTPRAQHLTQLIDKLKTRR